jgi:hypothetical protein
VFLEHISGLVIQQVLSRKCSVTRLTVSPLIIHPTPPTLTHKHIKIIIPLPEISHLNCPVHSVPDVLVWRVVWDAEGASLTVHLTPGPHDVGCRCRTALDMD